MVAHNRQRMDVETSTIALMLTDLFDHGIGFTPSSLSLTIDKIARRSNEEGLGFLTKTLPKLGKAVDALLLTGQFDCPDAFERRPGSAIPKLFGELLELICDDMGRIRTSACPKTIRHIRTLCYLFYKYKVSPTEAQNAEAILKFKDVDNGLKAQSEFEVQVSKSCKVALERLSRMRGLAWLVLNDLDLSDIMPRSGPGAVAGKEVLDQKFIWSNICERLWSVYGPEYFYPDLSKDLNKVLCLGQAEVPTRMLLVPKDSRGPRVISCESKEHQWIQQGIMRVLVDRIESHPLTKGKVNFRDQSINGQKALEGSKTLEWCTLDLAEASDRVSLRFVRNVFPDSVLPYLEAARATKTSLPNNLVVELNKFAPMGSALCFPVLAFSCWLALASVDIVAYVYGDDIIVPTAEAVRAIDALESIGLKANVSKCCFTGSFRESCGVDAYSGEDVTPVRIRTVWESSGSAAVYDSWRETANHLHSAGYHKTASAIAQGLEAIYGPIYRDPDGVSRHLPCLWFGDSELNSRLRKRWNRCYQAKELSLLVSCGATVQCSANPFANYLRSVSKSPDGDADMYKSPLWDRSPVASVDARLSVQPARADVYTIRHRNSLRRRWVTLS